MPWPEMIDGVQGKGVSDVRQLMLESNDVAIYMALVIGLYLNLPTVQNFCLFIN